MISKKALSVRDNLNTGASITHTIGVYTGPVQLGGGGGGGTHIFGIFCPNRKIHASPINLAGTWSPEYSFVRIIPEFCPNFYIGNFFFFFFFFFFGGGAQSLPLPPPPPSRAPMTHERMCILPRIEEPSSADASVLRIHTQITHWLIERVNILIYTNTHK